MHTPSYLTACRTLRRSSLLLAIALAAGALPALAQDPVFRVPVLEDVDPNSVEFNDRIIERDRSQPGMGAPTGTPTTADQNSGAAGGAGGSGAFGRGAPPNSRGGSQSSGSSSSGNDGGIDVNVSVSGQQLPSIFDGGGSGSGMPSGMPGSPGSPGSSGSPGMPGSDGSSDGSSSSNGGSTASSGGSDGDGGLDVNVNVTGGPQMPTFNIPGLPGSEGSSSGMPGMPGMPGSSSGSSNGNGSSSSDGSMAGTSAGQGGQSGSQAGSPGGMPGASGSSSGNGTMAGTGSGGGASTGRRAVLDRRLDESFGVFDGMIIAEREKAQTEADAAGSSVMGTGGGGGADGEGGGGEEGGTFGGAPEGAIVVGGGPQNSTGGGIMPEGGIAREGDYAYNDQPTYPVPEDIPSGDDDDVVARQLREAAMSEPDPELREKLWDEYRKYTGLSQ